MRKILTVLMVTLASVQLMAQLSSTVIPGVNKSSFERALKSRMEVHKVQINVLKENKVKNGMGDIVGIIDEGATNQRFYNIELLVDESVFNSRLHSVKCEVVLFKDSKDLLIRQCASETSTVKDMLINIAEL